jgi:PST family polysaccharide transporter
MSAEENSYGQILRSSSIVGGAQAANYLIALVRVKLVAILLGPAGVGLVGLYVSAMSLVGVVSGLGVSQSAVREVARARGADDREEAGRAIRTLRRACWATGSLGWGLAVLFRTQISVAMTGSPDHAGDIAWLGAMTMLGAISGGQLAHLQGLRRIGDLARANVAGAFLGSVATVLIYLALGRSGIVPALIAAGLASLGCSYWFARRVEIAAVHMSWRETWGGFSRLIGLGLAFVWSGLLVAGLDMFTRSLIARRLGIDAAGVYQAAWSLSGMFASFVLSAMGADFFPRLTGAIQDKERAARIVNEQIEIGILLALPGLLAALAFAPLAITLLYTRQFLPAADLLPWMALGVFGRVISWPMTYVQLSLGASVWFAATETACVGFQAGATFLLIRRFGEIGAAYAFALTYLFYTPLMLWATQTLISFRWSRGVQKLIVVSILFITFAFAVNFTLQGVPAALAGGLVTLGSSLFSFRSLAGRLSKSHYIGQLMNKVNRLGIFNRRNNWR